MGEKREKEDFKSVGGVLGPIPYFFKGTAKSAEPSDSSWGISNLCS